MSRVRSWLCFLYVWYSASGQKKFFFLWGGSIQGGLNKSSSTLYCNQQCWTMTPWGWRWGKSCHQLSQPPPCPPQMWRMVTSTTWGSPGSSSGSQLRAALLWLMLASCALAETLGGSAWGGYTWRCLLLFYTVSSQALGLCTTWQVASQSTSPERSSQVNQKKNWNHLVVSDSLRPHGL